MKNTKKISLIVLFLVTTIMVYAGGSKKIIINEFLATNATGLQDEDGEFSDWIELYNPGNTTINLQGWRLTDSKNKLDKWIFPSISIDAGKYLVVFASGKDRNNPANNLHTNFSLSKDGEYLGVVEPNGTVSDEYSPVFPPQQADISYGYYEGEIHFFETPTPGEENTLEKQAPKPVFSITRGFYNEPFFLSLSVSDADTKIYYTTDGTRPTAESRPYTEQIHITTTTPVSAVSIKNGIPSQIVTNSYFFIKDIVNQPNNPEGYPNLWGYLGGDVSYDNYKKGDQAPAYYAMDQNICNDPLYKNSIESAFLSIPSVSIVTNPGYLFSNSTDENEGGIYIHTGVTLGEEWERPVSIEYYDPSTKKQFQINCGLKLHGAASRQPEKTPKHSFKAYFRKLYGNGKLNFDLFEKETAVKEFDHLVFRAGYNLSWVHPDGTQRKNSQYTIDSFAKRIQQNMGQLSTHDRFVHLFINGLYWGLYNVSERITEKFMVSYFGGEETDYDVINHDGLAAGDLLAYQRMVDLGKSGNYDQLLSEKIFNAENFIDYMLLNFYLGNTDWPHNNWYASVNHTKPDKSNGFAFISWDAETSFQDVYTNRVSGFQGDFRRILFGSSTSYSASGGGLYNNEDFKLLFADRVQKHFFNGGCLSPEKAAQFFEEVSKEIDLPIILESARWGNYRKSILPPKGSLPSTYTRNEHWLKRKQLLYDDYFPLRTYVVHYQLESAGLIPDIAPPSFSSYGKKIIEPVNLSMTTIQGKIYYTTDGKDPREHGTGNIAVGASEYKSPLQITSACIVKARVKKDDVWSALSEATFTGSGNTNLSSVVSNKLSIYYQQGILYLTLPKNENVPIQIYSVTGNLVKTIQADHSISVIDVSNFQKGVYVVKLNNQVLKFTK